MFVITGMRIARGSIIPCFGQLAQILPGETTLVRRKPVAALAWQSGMKMHLKFWVKSVFGHSNRFEIPRNRSNH